MSRRVRAIGEADPERFFGMHHSSFGPFDIAAILVVLAAILGYLNHRYVRLPHAIGLTVMGALASLGMVGSEAIFPSLGLGKIVERFLADVDFARALLRGMLSFLLFAGAMHVNLDLLLRGRWIILLAATAGVVVSTILVGAGFWAVTQAFDLDLPFAWCLVFGALISPTDPVAVLGILKGAGVRPRLEASIAGESLFNDGVGVVVFSILVAMATGAGSFSLGHAGELFALEALGGVALGLAIGWTAYAAMKRIDEHNIEIMITLAVVMGGYSAAEGLGVSGPVAMAVAGLLIGNHGVTHAMSETTMHNLTNFWSLVDELLNSVLFLLIGLEAIHLIGRLAYLEAGIVAIVIALAARAVSIGGSTLLLLRWAPFGLDALPVLIWGGLRGGISVAMALSLKGTPFAEPIVIATYVVVIFSVVIQGLTVRRVTRLTTAGMPDGE